MINYTLHQVKSKSDIRKFLKVATVINGSDPVWIQPLDNDIENIFDPSKNPLFDQGEASRWILYDGDRLIGRIAAFYNNKSAAMEEQLTGGCGFFECIDDQAAANILFDTAKEWLTDRGMEAMDGSINFGDRMSWWGVLAEGFTRPIYGMNYNQPYYTTLFEAYGFMNYFNQHTYLRPMDNSIELNPAVLEKMKRIWENKDYSFSTGDMNNLPKLAEDFRKVYNSGWAKFEGVEPMTAEHAQSIMATMKPVIDPELIHFAYYKGEAVGFFIMIPDLNQIIGSFKGKFGWWQKILLMHRLKNTQRIDCAVGIVFGVAAEQQGKGVEAGLIGSFELIIKNRIIENNVKYKTLEMMWVGDFNPVMMRMCENYVRATKFKRHITYRYLFDRTKPFKRCPRVGTKR